MSDRLKGRACLYSVSEIISNIMKRFQRSAIAAVVLIFFLVLALSQTLVRLLTDAWWFESVGYTDVFWTRVTWQILIWVLTFAVYSAFLYANYRIAMHISQRQSIEAFDSPAWGQGTFFVSRFVIAAILFVAFVAAMSSVSAWETFLKYLNPSEFGITDPIYGRDIGFYFFRLPLYEGIQSWLLTLCFLGLIVAIAVYAAKEITILGNQRQRDWKYALERRLGQLLTGKAKIHLSLLLAAIAFLLALGFWFDRFELLYSADGVVFGAGYTDVNARLQAYWFMLFGTLALAFLFIATLWRRSFNWALYGLGIYLVANILVTGVYPWAQQRFIVQPNELEKERPYIANNIELTNQAYDLTEIDRRGFPAENALTQASLATNAATLRNIRLWDYRPLLSTYRQLQEIRPYYRFRDVDIDRYTLDDNYRQVMLSPRELDYDQVPADAQTWVNERLKYTHGYGVVLSPVNQVTSEGLPTFFIRDIPPVSEVDLEITEAAIYYGEETDNYIFTGMSTAEFDYPQGNSNASTFYEGTGGVPIPSIWQRLAYAYDFGSLETVISNYFTSDSRIHYRRNIRDRIQTIAPFLQLDNDPYIAIIDGRVQWIVDAYTVGDRFPYSEPAVQTADIIPNLSPENVENLGQGNLNYIRNSVKIVVDAFDGTLQFYVTEPDDPVLATYRKIFPTLFVENDAIPAEVQQHFRYPLDLFKVQSQIYLLYHMTNPEVFYNREDLWRFPTEVYEGNEVLMEPYYIIMRLPERESEEFILIMPFVPVSRDNMIAWMAGNSDGMNYGELLLYEFPKQELVFGPSQIEARIDQNPEISQQLTLWSQEGSRVIRGDLLVIPVEQSLLYVEPVYLRAEQGELPELRRVIVGYADQVVMRETLEEALSAIFGGTVSAGDGTPAPEPTDGTAPPALSGDARSLIDSLADAYDRAQTALSEGEWERYGEAQAEIEALIEQLQQQSDVAVPQS